MEKRRPNLSHFEKYDWLVFSESKQGLFCKFCAIFSHSNFTSKLVREPLQKYSKLSGDNENSDLYSHNVNLKHKNEIIDG